MSKLSDAFARRKNIPYPTTRSDYTAEVAKAAEITYTKVMMNMGLDIEPHLIQHHEADIVEESYSLGGEVWNWSAPHCYEAREISVTKNLEPFAKRHLLTSFISDNVSYRITAAYNDNPIEITELGFQILPNDYLPWATANKVTYGVRFCNKRTDKILRNRLLSNPRIREVVANAKAKISAPKVKVDSDNTEKVYDRSSCYVYTRILSIPLDTKFNLSKFISLVFFNTNILMGLRNHLCKVFSSMKARLSASSLRNIRSCFASPLSHIKLSRAKYPKHLAQSQLS